MIYDTLYSHGYNPISVVALSYIERLRFEPGKTLLDVGCGRGHAVEVLTEMGLDAQGCDIIDPSHVIPIRYTKGFPEGEFDYVTCFDVLEHLSDPVSLIQQIKKACKGKAYISVSHRPADHKGPNGEQLHLTIQGPEWWLDTFLQLFDIERVEIDGDSSLWVLT